MSVDVKDEDEGYSAEELEDLEARRPGGRLSGSPVFHLGRDGEELYENGEPVVNDDEVYYLYRLERLVRTNQQDDLELNLLPSSVFIKSVSAQTPTMEHEQFRNRLKRFLKELGQPTPTAEIIDCFFHLAVQAHKEILAWENSVLAIKSDEFERSLERLQAAVARFEKIRKIFQADREMPTWMSRWERLWIEAFEELEGLIEGQLRGAKSYLGQLSALAKLGRTDVESQVLLLKKEPIKDAIKKTTLSKTPAVALAAFAYGARIVRSKDDENDPKGRYVDLIKARIRRAEHSKARMNILATLLMGHFHSTEVAEDQISQR